MGELSLIQIVIVLVVALLVFGPSRMPEIGRQMGKGLRELRKHASSVGEELQRAVDSDAPAEAPKPRVSAAPSPPAVPDEDLLDGVVVPADAVSAGSTTQPAVPVAAVEVTHDDLLDGVVVSGDTPVPIPSAAPPAAT